MGLTSQSTGMGALRETFSDKGDYVVALAGNPNTGKSTVFNALTGLNQHTGNWPGKTVLQARGSFRHRGKEITLVDLPGTYSLLANSPEEQVARDFICFAEPDATVVVADATCLERNLNLVLQVMEITPRVIVCLNLMDEARRRRLSIDTQSLGEKLGVPVVPAAARSGQGLERLKDLILEVACGSLTPVPMRLTYPRDIEEAVNGIAADLAPVLRGRLNERWVALRLVDGDYSVLSSIEEYLKAQPGARPDIKAAERSLSTA